MTSSQMHAHQEFCTQLAGMAARWYQSAGFHLSDELLPTQPERLAGSPASGVLAAAIELRSVLQSSPEGRKALAHFGFEPVLQKVEGE